MQAVASYQQPLSDRLRDAHPDVLMAVLLQRNGWDRFTDQPRIEVVLLLQREDPIREFEIEEDLERALGGGWLVHITSVSAARGDEEIWADACDGQLLLDREQHWQRLCSQ